MSGVTGDWRELGWMATSLGGWEAPAGTTNWSTDLIARAARHVSSSYLKQMLSYMCKQEEERLPCEKVTFPSVPLPPFRHLCVRKAGGGRGIFHPVDRVGPAQVGGSGWCSFVGIEAPTTDHLVEDH